MIVYNLNSKSPVPKQLTAPILALKDCSSGELFRITGIANFLPKLAIGLVLLLVTVCDNLETAVPKGARTVFANDIVCRAFVETFLGKVNGCERLLWSNFTFNLNISKRIKTEDDLMWTLILRHIYIIFFYTTHFFSKQIKNIIHFMHLDKNSAFIFYDTICKAFWVVNLKNGYG